MLKSFEFCLPTKANAVPSSPDWFHEIKFDGYRMRLERDGDRVRLITRGGYNWTDRYAWIVSAQAEGSGNAQSSRQISASRGPLLVKADIQQPCRKDLTQSGNDASH